MSMVGQFRTVSKLEEALRERICGVCIDRLEGGACETTCTLFEKLPQVAVSIARVKSTRMEDYVNAIRDDICAKCTEQIEDFCASREEGRCVLDRYLPIIVNVIEETQGNKQ
ncbi:MAG: hypothetical protein HYX72_10325 [Acidobacteria bacterium]|nr:hypothetical protein [Acidobacteriota bacterium]